MTGTVDLADVMALVPTLDDNELRSLAARIYEEAKSRGLAPRRNVVRGDVHPR